MARLDDGLWAAVNGHEDADLAPPARPDEVAAFETRHGFELPPDHREFLRRANGGVVGYVRLFGVGRSDALDLGGRMAQMKELLEATAAGPVVPFASDWGGSYYCYDLRRRKASGDYAVLFWNHEYSEEPEDRPVLWSKFAPDFATFVRKVVA